ncbi:unnamed protein product [Somion occarium]|uniref:Uncharacterized protein n=1 Tax=Somion occarium TaxID=3059160 RepID=A0ABP1E603_9APHY
MGLASKVYAEQLGARGYGIPLWRPEPSSYGEVCIGDVGFVEDGAWFRLFNVTKPQSDPLNSNGVPPNFELLQSNSRLINRSDNFLDPGVLCSSSMSQMSLGADASGEMIPIDLACRYTCSRNEGALLVLKDHATSEAVFANAQFVEYMLRHHQSWCDFARNQGFLLDKEDIILVRGWVKTTSWTVAAFTNQGDSLELTFGSKANLYAHVSVSTAVSTHHSHSVEYRDGPNRMTKTMDEEPSPQRKDQCVFLRYYKIKYRTPAFLGRKITARVKPKDNRDIAHGTVSSASESQYKTRGRRQTYTSSPNPVDDILDYLLDNSSAQMAISSDEDLNRLSTTLSPTSHGLSTTLRELAPKVVLLGDAASLGEPVDDANDKQFGTD